MSAIEPEPYDPVSQLAPGNIVTTGLWTLRPDGSVVLSSSKNAGAFLTSRGLTMNADGSMYIFKKGAVTSPPCTKTSDGFGLVVGSGALLTSASKVPGAYTDSSGFTYNPDGTMLISSTKQAGSSPNSHLFTFNPDGSLFAY